MFLVHMKFLQAAEHPCEWHVGAGCRRAARAGRLSRSARSQGGDRDTSSFCKLVQSVTLWG